MRCAFERRIGAGQALALLMCASAAADGVTRLTTEGGLTVICRPVEGARHVAVVTLFKIGDHDDPAGRSGMAHLLEHLWVMAPTDTAASRVAEVIDGIREGTYKAVTHDRCTVCATVIPRDRVEEELRGLAGRMGTLRIEERDVARERRSVAGEQEERFWWFSSGTAGALARERVLPPPHGGCSGGAREHLEKMTAAELRDRWHMYYKPRNTVLVLVGRVDAKDTERVVTSLFAGLPAGEPVPPQGKQEIGGPFRMETLHCSEGRPNAKPYACYCWVAPDPGSDDFAPFLVLAARLKDAANVSEVANVQYVPLVSSTIGLVAPSEGEDGFGTLDALLNGLAAPVNDNDVDLVRLHFGFILGLTIPGDWMLSEPGNLRQELGENLCGLALSLAHRERLAFSSEKVAKALEAVSNRDLERARALLAPGRAAKVLLLPDSSESPK